MSNLTIYNLEKAAAILSTIPEQFIFTGGATIVLYANQDILHKLRPTKDVDCVVEIVTRTEYYKLAKKLKAKGLSECIQPNSPLCRWQYDELIIDIMPCEKEVLGFTNRWYPGGITKSISYTLPSQTQIQIFSPIYLLSTKIEAYLGRGTGFRFSKDIEDIIVLFDGSNTLEEDYHLADQELRQYIQDWFTTNVDELTEAVYSFCPSSDPQREDSIIELIERIAS